MRLRMPTIQHLESEDGSCSLTYEGLDEAPAQAGGGGKYLLRVSHPEGDIEVRATLQSVGTLYRAREHARSEGFDYGAMSLTEKGEYLYKFAEKYGRSSYVVLFEIESEGDHSDIAELSKRFCEMFFEMDASFRLNNSEYPACGEGYYPDEVDFSPWDVDKKYSRCFQAGEA